MKKLKSKRVLAAILFLLALFLVRPRVGLLHRTVTATLSYELGRPVEMTAVHLRFLPRPGLELENLTIHNNAEFGAEPLLRSPDVTAWLRFSSLLRGRIEISTLSLSDASLNLGRNSQGKWNIEELLERASRSSTAPTASSRKEPRREFPYIEADHGRINFKDGLEKIHFALTNAEFAFWQDSENQWGMRLTASPIRTDANLTDTGTINVNGTWRRSLTLADTPIQFSLEWKQAQIGQASQLLSGSDQGWRGSVFLDGSVSGTLGNSRVSTDLSVDELRRQDIFASGDLRVSAHCTAEYHSDQQAIRDLDCTAPAGDGSLELKGSAAAIPSHSYDLMLLAKNIPAQSVLGLAGHAKKYFPDQLRATGTVNMVVSLNRNGADTPLQLQGNGEALGLRLSSARSGAEFQLGTVPIRLITPAAKKSNSKTRFALQDEEQLQVGPAMAALGRSSAVQAEISLSRIGLQGFLRGDATLKRLEQAAEMLQIPFPQIVADGNTTLNLALNHEWGATSPGVVGTALLHSVRAQVRGLNSPLLIHRADLAISPDSVRVTNLDSSAGATTWRGSLLLPRPCAIPDSCAFEFNLHSPQLSAFALNQLLNPAAASRPWYSLLDLATSHSFFSRASASGSIAVDKLILGNTACNHVSADLQLKGSKLSLSNLRGQSLGGNVTANLLADFSVHPPAYSGAGSFDAISLAAISNLMHTQWAEGAASASYQFKTAGWNIPDLLQSAELKASFRVKDTVFPHVVLAENTDPLHALAFSGQLTLQQGAFSFQNAELKSEDVIFNLSGTASLAGALQLKLRSENSGAYTLSGTLDRTQVSPIPTPPTQAELKP